MAGVELDVCGMGRGSVVGNVSSCAPVGECAVPQTKPSSTAEREQTRTTVNFLSSREESLLVGGWSSKSAPEQMIGKGLDVPDCLSESVI